MDLPWNPAVLEQRIGRVHRLGQKQPVQVVNFVAQGTIEEGMLSLLRFKKSLFAGVLDGGEQEVFLGGTRLARFMESVEKATAGAGAPEVQEPVVAEAEADPAAASSVPREETVASAADATAAATSAAGGAAAGDAWGQLIDAGLKAVTQLLAAAQSARDWHPGRGRIRRWRPIKPPAAATTVFLCRTRGRSTSWRKCWRSSRGAERDC